MRKRLIRIIGLLAALVAGLIIAFALILVARINIPLDAEPDWLYRYQLKYETQMSGDQLIGGGYFYLFDDRDLWIRFEATEGSQLTNLSGFQACTSEQSSQIRTWFQETVRDRHSILDSINPWLSLPPQDQASLSNNASALRCYIRGTISYPLGKVPQESGWWLLYNPATRFYYLRYANYT